MTNNIAPVTAEFVDAKVNYRLDFGPRLGWGTALGLLLLGISLIVWSSAQSIVVGLMNGGHLMETSGVTTLSTIQRNALFSSAAGSVFSLRIAVGLLQALLLGLSILTRSRNADQRQADQFASEWRPGRYATDVDTGGPTGLLTRFQIFLSGIPRRTAAILSKAAVFLWIGFMRSRRLVRVGGRVISSLWQASSVSDNRLVLVNVGDTTGSIAFGFLFSIHPIIHSERNAWRPIAGRRSPTHRGMNPRAIG